MRRDICYLGTLLLCIDWFSTINALWSGDTCQMWTGDRQITKFSIHYLVWGDSLQPVNTSTILIFTHIEQILLSYSETCWAVQHEWYQRQNLKQSLNTKLFFNTGEALQINNIDDSWIRQSFSAFIQHFFYGFLPFHQKNGIQKKKSYIRTEGSSHESAGLWLFMQHHCAGVEVWKIANFQDQDYAKFIYTFLKFYLAYSSL